MLDFIIGIDVKLMYFFNVTLHNPIFNFYMPLFHEGDNWRIPLIIMWVLLMIFGGTRGRWAGLGGVLIIALSDPISSHLIKPIVGRIRPCNVLGGLWFYGDGGWLLTPEVITKVYKGSLSFTSSHAANTLGQAIWWGSAISQNKMVLVGTRFFGGIFKNLRRSALSLRRAGWLGSWGVLFCSSVVYC